MLIPPDDQLHGGKDLCLCCLQYLGQCLAHGICSISDTDYYREEEVASFVHIQCECEQSAISFF